jgi:hypothetical protein
MVIEITGQEPRSQPAAIARCRLSDFHPPQLSVLQPPLTAVMSDSVGTGSRRDGRRATARRYEARESAAGVWSDDGVEEPCRCPDSAAGQVQIGH